MIFKNFASPKITEKILKIFAANEKVNEFEDKFIVLILTFFSMR